jgi:hypothetical protein
MEVQPLTNEQLYHYVPSAFAVEPWERMSRKYRLIPTIDVIAHLRVNGFHPVRATQGRTRLKAMNARAERFLASPISLSATAPAPATSRSEGRRKARHSECSRARTRLAATIAKHSGAPRPHRC